MRKVQRRSSLRFTRRETQEPPPPVTETSDNEDDQAYNASDDEGDNTRQHPQTANPTPNPQPSTEKSAIPAEYLEDPTTASPILDNLNAINHSRASLEELLHAADADATLHRSRILAAQHNDESLLSSSYEPASDPAYRERIERKTQRDETISTLQTQSDKILEELNQPPSRSGMTQAEIQRERLGRWQRAMELYVFIEEQKKIDLLGLLDKLCEGCSEEEELLEALSQASQMCSSLVDATTLSLQDASKDAAEVEDAFRIRIEAHEIFARRACLDAEEIEDRFFSSGKAAMKIGQQLELAEAKRRKCESASILLKRWWNMENLAEREAGEGGEPIRVEEEVRGVRPPETCKMEPLYTLTENSLEAAMTLKSLRLVLKNRGSATSAGMIDPSSIRRFELTGKLIQRTSTAIEARLINSFSKVYAQGGTYDFDPNNSGRSGRLNWVKLRDVAQALTCFDNGRNLHKRYVQLVITIRFPELDERMMGEEEEDEEEDEDMDITRSKLTKLFLRVNEVCTSEFELISHVFCTNDEDDDDESVNTDTTPFQVTRLLLQRIISDPKNGLTARIIELLESIDQRSDFDAGAKKLDTIVVIHETAAGIFSLLKEAAEQHLLRKQSSSETQQQEETDGKKQSAFNAQARAMASLMHFLTSQEIFLSNGQRRGYLNLELRLLHHECCDGLDRVGARMLPPVKNEELYYSRDKPNDGTTGPGVTIEYRAPILPLDTEALRKGGYGALLEGALKSIVLRQPITRAIDSLARARLMFGKEHGGDPDALARVITAIYTQMCGFYGQGYLFPIIEALGEMLDLNPPTNPPALPFNEDLPPHDMGVDGRFWVCVERVMSAAKAYDRELWAENRQGSIRVWEILVNTGSHSSLTLAREKRTKFFREMEEKGEATILGALDTLSRHIQWILVTGGESTQPTGGNRLLQGLTHQAQQQTGGPYAVAAGGSLEAPNSPAVQSLTYCLRAQFVHVQAALTSQSLSSFWTALSMRLYDILCARLLQHYFVSTVGAVILSRDVEALRSVAMLAGTDHVHWDILRELLTLYMTPPDALKTILVGPEGDIKANKGLFARAGQEQSLMFMSRRLDFRVKTNQGMKKSRWAMDLLCELGVKDPTEGPVNIAKFSAERKSMA